MKRRHLQAGLIAAATLFVYGPSLRGGWIWDDLMDYPQQRLPVSLAGWARIWNGEILLDYYPIKATVQWAQWLLWGKDTLGYHLTNVSLHLLSALLLWRLLGKLGLRHAWLGGLLLAVHPLAVESVAWITELKNALSLPPLLLAMGAYIDWDGSNVAECASISPNRRKPCGLFLRRPKRHPPEESLRDAPAARHLGAARSVRYGLALFWFLIAMLCKSSVVMFPVLILLYAWWRRGRVAARDLWASSPFFAISLALGLLEIWFQRHRGGTAGQIVTPALYFRFAEAGLSAAFYFCKCVLPVRHLLIYPRWRLDSISWIHFLPWVSFGSVFCWLRRAYRDRTVLFGLGWFAVNLAPVSGLVAMAFLRISWVADHFAYLSLLGIIGLAVAGLDRLHLRWPARAGLIRAATAVVCLALAVEARACSRLYRDEEAMWGHVVARNPDSVIVRDNYGRILYHDGRNTEAQRQYEAALKLQPGDAMAENDLGNALQGQGRIAEALRHFDASLKIDPGSSGVHVDRGNTLLQAGRMAEAMAEFEAALRLDPASANAHYSLGDALIEQRRVPEAIENFSAAVRLKPDFAAAHANLGSALALAGRTDEAIGEFHAAIRIDPDYLAAHFNLGMALRKIGQREGAIREYEEVIRLEPNNAKARQYLWQLRGGKGKP